MRRHINLALKILTKIFADGAYSNMALNGEDVSDMTTYLVYGVLDDNVKIEYILSQLLNKKPQNQIYVLLKIGTYAITHLKNVPQFAIVSECVEVAKMNGKSAVSGFVNAVLKKVCKGEYSLPNEKAPNYLSICYSKPQWFVSKMIEQYGIDVTKSVLQGENSQDEHIRVNSRLTNLQEVQQVLGKNKCKYRVSDVGGLIVKVEKIVKQLFAKGHVTYQSPSSMLAVQALNPSDNSNILDLCSAPGGKAIYMSELCPHSPITACDLHEHRVQLIEKYKERMHAPNVKAVCADATKLVDEWKNRYDFVLVDAPCSCFGTYKKHPDVFLTRGESEIYNLAKTQREILSVASNYVADGGVLLYSTCTIFKEENQDNVAWFLKNYPEFALEEIENLANVDGGKYVDNDGQLQILPHDEYDGFFIARLRKVSK